MPIICPGADVGQLGSALRNAIDRLVVDIDEVVRAWADRVDTINLGVRILNARSGGRTDPIVLSHDDRHIGHGIPVRRPAKVRRRTPVDLLYLAI